MKRREERTGEKRGEKEPEGPKKKRERTRIHQWDSLINKCKRKTPTCAEKDRAVAPCNDEEETW